jgi:hypothetical protein
MYLLLLSQPTYYGSLAADEDDVDSVRHDMGAQCGTGGQLPPQYTYEVVVSFVGEMIV